MPRWEPDARFRLVTAALELFEEQGYEATAVADIAARAGLTKTTFFRHFPNKREVLSAGQELHAQTLAEGVLSAPRDATPFEAVGHALEALSRTFTVAQRAIANRLARVTATSPDLQERAALKQAGYVEAMRDALTTRGVEAIDALVAAELGHLAFMTGFRRWSAAGVGTGDDDAAAEELVAQTRLALVEIRARSLALN